MEIIVGQDNKLTSTWVVTTGVGTLVIEGLVGWDLGLTSIDRIFSTEANDFFYIGAGTTFTDGPVEDGLFAYSWTIPQIPAASTSADVLVIYLNVNPQQAQILLLQNLQA